MRNTILGIIALGFFGACSSDSKNEVGRYVPIIAEERGIVDKGILDTKTGMIYQYRYDYDPSAEYRKKPIRVLITEVNPIEKQVTNFYINVKIGK
jgi:hypothetical protein